MFLSKVSPCLKFVRTSINTENGIVGILAPKFMTTDVTVSTTNISAVQESDNTESAEKANPDKLYKKVAIEVRGNDPMVLKSYTTFSFLAAENLGITLGQSFIPRKPVHERLTLLKAAHVQKKWRVQYETRTYYRIFELLRLTGSTADTYLEYIERNLPEGVAMKVTKVEIQRLPETIKGSAAA